MVQLLKVYEIQRSLDGLLLMGFTEDDVLEEIRRFSARFFEDQMKAQGKTRWADKTNHYVDHMDTIEKVFKGETIYIGIVRHGLDVANSLKEHDWGMFKDRPVEGDEKIITAVQFWREQNEKILAFMERHKERFHLVRYEQLTQNPREALMKLCEFIDEPFDEDMMNYGRFEHGNGFGDTKTLGHNAAVKNSGKYKVWPLDLQKRAFAEAGEMFARLRYEL